MRSTKTPRALVVDIETAPLLSYTWGLWDQNIGLNQIHTDGRIIAWGARWLDDPKGKVMYADLRKGISDAKEKRILTRIWKLLDEAQVVVTQNGKSFDEKVLNARFVMHGFKPPSPYKRYDTKLIAKKCFRFTSNRLEYMADRLNKTYKKLKHEKFAGFELWRECLKGNQKAWAEMEKYNKYDVLTLEELYHTLSPWDPSVNYNVFRSAADAACNCGSKDVVRRGYAYTPAGKYQQYCCRACGSWTRGRTNLLDKARVKSLKARVA